MDASLLMGYSAFEDTCCSPPGPFICGGCGDTLNSICTLHTHMRDQHSDGSYHYDTLIKTAFPKYDTICTGSQTSRSDKIYMKNLRRSNTGNPPQTVNGLDVKTEVRGNRIIIQSMPDISSNQSKIDSDTHALLSNRKDSPLKERKCVVKLEDINVSSTDNVEPVVKWQPPEPSIDSHGALDDVDTEAKVSLISCRTECDFPVHGILYDVGTDMKASPTSDVTECQLPVHGTLGDVGTDMKASPTSDVTECQLPVHGTLGDVGTDMKASPTSDVTECHLPAHGTLDDVGTDMKVSPTSDVTEYEFPVHGTLDDVGTDMKASPTSDVTECHLPVHGTLDDVGTDMKASPTSDMTERHLHVHGTLDDVGTDMKASSTSDVTECHLHAHGTLDDVGTDMKAGPTSDVTEYDFPIHGTLDDVGTDMKASPTYDVSECHLPVQTPEHSSVDYMDEDMNTNWHYILEPFTQDAACDDDVQPRTTSPDANESKQKDSSEIKTQRIPSPVNGANKRQTRNGHQRVGSGNSKIGKDDTAPDVSCDSKKRHQTRFPAVSSDSNKRAHSNKRAQKQRKRGKRGNTDSDTAYSPLEECRQTVGKVRTLNVNLAMKQTQNDVKAKKTTPVNVDTTTHVKGEGNNEDQRKKKKKKYKDKYIICHVCGKTFKSSSMEAHMNVHSGLNPYVCDVCAMAYPSKPKLLRHQQRHYKRMTVGRFICQECGRNFIAKVAYLAHVRRHTGAKPHQCEQCGAVFSTKKYMRRHIKEQHEMERRSYGCKVCGKVYLSPVSITGHMATAHTEPKLPCTHCGRMFHTNRVRINHEWTHSNKKRYVCWVCDYGCIQKTPYFTHMLKQHGIDRAEVLQMEEARRNTEIETAKSAAAKAGVAFHDDEQQ